jgi:hypothetical protein
MMIATPPVMDRLIFVLFFNASLSAVRDSSAQDKSVMSPKKHAELLRCQGGSARPRGTAPNEGAAAGSGPTYRELREREGARRGRGDRVRRRREDSRGLNADVIEVDAQGERRSRSECDALGLIDEVTVATRFSRIEGHLGCHYRNLLRGLSIHRAELAVHALPGDQGANDREKSKNEDRHPCGDIRSRQPESVTAAGVHALNGTR